MNWTNSKNDFTDISILSAHDINNNLLIDFYRRVWPNRLNHNIWKWLNRTSYYNNKIPLIILHRNEVVAHAGIIPFKVLVDDKCYTASWFIDFAVLPEFQRQGLGIKLTKQWMEFSDLNVTFCNEKSMGIFKKFGWIESFKTYHHIYPLLAFDHPFFVRHTPIIVSRVLNTLSSRFYKLIYNKYDTLVDNLKFLPVNKESLREFMLTHKVPVKNAVLPVRDVDYLKWRLLNSPDKEKYRIIMNDKSSIIVKMANNHSRYIDILWVSNPFAYTNVRDIISALGIWGLTNNYSYIRHAISNKRISNYYRKHFLPFVWHPRFAYYTKDAELYDKIKKYKWDYDLIDSDFERFREKGN